MTQSIHLLHYRCILLNGRHDDMYKLHQPQQMRMRSYEYIYLYIMAQDCT